MIARQATAISDFVQEAAAPTNFASASTEL
jgi:hypothetical protein